MSSKAQKKEEVKKNLRSLLLSAPAALTIDELKRDYHDFIMEPIPFRALGYVTIEDLLKDMSDALYVTWKKGVMCVAGIADSNTAHIQKLVSKQKVANKNKWATLRKGGPPPQRHRTQQPRPLPTVPPFIRNYLTQLFKSYPDGLPFTHFDAAFSKRFNIQIDPIRLGFTSLRELLKSVPYILEVKELQNGEVRVCPVSKSCKFIKARNEDDKMYFDNLIDLWHGIVSLNNLEFEFYSFFFWQMISHHNQENSILFTNPTHKIYLLDWRDRDLWKVKTPPNIQSIQHFHGEIKATMSNSLCSHPIHPSL